LRLPRDLGGTELAALLRSLRLRGHPSNRKPYAGHVTPEESTEHHVTIPRHEPLRVGTLSAILADVASYLETSRSELVADLFGR
jgi:hypothetical protein